jgi:hypothetical protein
MPYPANCKVGTLRLLSAERERRPAESQEQFASSGARCVLQLLVRGEVGPPARRQSTPQSKCSPELDWLNQSSFRTSGELGLATASPSERRTGSEGLGRKVISEK